MKRRYQPSIFVVSLLLCFCMVLPLASCQSAPSETETPAPTAEVENLEKLCKVWGYTKYRHPAFLKGEKDWDAELLALIQQVQAAKNGEEVNTLLYNWFVGLGEIDWGGRPTSVTAWLSADEEDKIFQADTSWIDEAYLGADLPTALEQIYTVPNIKRDKAPVSFTELLYPIFSNEKTYENFDYGDVNYRLLSLFRLWNTIEYYSPYLDILDEDWEDILPEYISKMLAATDRASYELAIFDLGMHLHDNHVGFLTVDTAVEEFGLYFAPVSLIQAEGKIVVHKQKDNNCPLLPGDVILSIDSTPVEERIEAIKKYQCVTTPEKLGLRVLPLILRSKAPTMKVTVERDGQQMTFDVDGVKNGRVRPVSSEKASVSHQILDDNIGLINPNVLKDNEIFAIMQEFKDTDSMIVDLRQYPSSNLSQFLAYYLIVGKQQFALRDLPSCAVPGAFLRVNDENCYSGFLPYEGREQTGLYLYPKNVVILINQYTCSQGETTTLSLRNGEKVTLMGSNTIGSDGDMLSIPLPDGNEMTFSAHGYRAADGSQVQRVGIPPDIRVEPTIQGIKEGRDELMEAAVQYLKDNQ